MVYLSPKEREERAKELKPARDFAYKLFKSNPKIEAEELRQKLAEANYEVTPNTIYTWLLRWRKQKEKGKVTWPKQPKVSWESIISSVPDKVELGVILVDGIVGTISNLKSKIETLEKEKEELVKDRKNIMQQLNEYITKEKTGGHFTIDQTKKTLIPNPEHKRQ